MFRSGLISYSNGGLILRPLFTFKRADFYCPIWHLTSAKIFLALAGLLSCFPAYADPLRVHVVLSERGGAYQAFSDALHDDLQSQSVIFSIGEPDERGGEADVVIAVGMRAATTLVAGKKPVLNVFVPKAGYEKLPKPALARHSSAIYLDQPLERQLSLLVAALPRTRHVGVLYTVPPPGLAALRQLISEKHLFLHEKVVGQEHDLVDALDGVLEESEALLVLPDTDVYNAGTIRNILLTSYRKQVPLIGISQAYVKAGALCAIYSTPVQIAAQTAEAVRQFAATAKLPVSQYPKDFEVSVNMQVARSLDLPIKDAEKLRDEIRRNP